MQVGEAMTREVQGISSEKTIQEAATVMSIVNAGALPVSDGSRLIGIITDRDITIRATAAGKGASTPVGDVMTRGVIFCYEDADLEQAAQSMAAAQVRRLVVIDKDKALVGIVSLGDVALNDPVAGLIAVRCVSAPPGEDPPSPLPT